ncbi:MAG: fumarylacetoacetate hydrolase family protein [Gammaproteobacteria bacterium]
MKLVMLADVRLPGAILGDQVLSLGQLPEFDPSTQSSIEGILAAGQLQLVQQAIETVQEGGDAVRERLIEQGALRPLSSVELLAPFPRPGLIFFTGGNYKAHIEEIAKRTGMDLKPPENPIGFIQNSNSVIGPGAEIRLPKNYPDMVDFEVEFSFVISKPCHNVSREEAMDYIAGYTVVNDISARDWNESARRPDGSMDLTMLTLGKQFPTFCPMGPTFVTPDEVPDPYDVDVSLTLNGEVMQNANTSDLLFGFEEILSYFSDWFEFRPGDVITTGAPPGVGFARNPPVFLRPGDEVSITASAVGTQTNSVVGPST